MTKVKTFKHHCFYHGYSTYSHRIPAAFPPLDHQKHGPGNCLPLWHPNHRKISKKIRKDIIPDPVWPERFLDMLEIFSKVLKIEGREVFVESDIIIVRVTDCETQKAIAKAGVCFTDPDIFLPFLVILFWEVFSEMRPPALVSFKS